MITEELLTKALEFCLARCANYTDYAKYLNKAFYATNETIGFKWIDSIHKFRSTEDSGRCNLILASTLTDCVSEVFPKDTVEIDKEGADGWKIIEKVNFSALTKRIKNLGYLL